jgi:hypothetical protein
MLLLVSEEGVVETMGVKRDGGLREMSGLYMQMWWGHSVVRQNT